MLSNNEGIMIGVFFAMLLLTSNVRANEEPNNTYYYCVQNGQDQSCSITNDREESRQQDCIAYNDGSVSCVSTGA